MRLSFVSFCLATLIGLITITFFSLATPQPTVGAQTPANETDPTPQSLFGAINARTAAMASQQLQPELTEGMARTRMVTVNFAQLSGMNGAPLSADNIADSLRLNLFDGTELLAVRDKLQQNASGSYTWVGHVEGEPLSEVILVVRDNTLFGGIQVPGLGEFAIQPLDGSYHLIQEAGPHTILPKDDTHVAVADTSAQRATQPKGVPQAGVTTIQAAPGSTADDGSLIDVLVVYSDDVAQANAQSFAEMFIAYTNQAYENSGINQRVWLVDTEQFTYNETGSLSSDLGNITNNSTPNVLAHRNQYHADLVLFFVSNDGGGSGSCSGLAWLQTNITPSFENLGYSTMKACSFGSSVFAHELGHNMGSRHDWYMDAGTTPFTYAHGYVDTVNKFRTIMSYNNRCNALGFSCSGIPYFSNPNVNYNGATTGVAGGTASNCAAGNSGPATQCDADEHRTFNETAANTAGFRSSQLTWTGATSTDWSNAANWTIDEGVPGATAAAARAPRSIDNIYIPSGITRMPVISSGSVTAREVVIASGATLQMSGGTLTVGWRWQDSGGFQGTGGTVIFSGPLDIAVTSASGSAFKDVQIGDGVSTPDVTLSSNLDINGKLTLKSGAQLKPGSHTINLTGNWSDEGNGFTPGTSTVIFDGASQSVSKVTSTTLINENFNSYTDCCGWNTSGFTPPTGWERQTVGGGSGWLLGDQGATRVGSSTDGWLFTAAVALQPNVQYQISYDVYVLDQSPFTVINPQSITVTYGSNQSSNAVVATVDTVTTSSENSTPRMATFTVATAGTYYIGFRTTQTITGDWLFLDNVVLTSNQNLLFYNVQVASGTTTFNQPLTLQNNLSVSAGSTANVGTNTITVDGTVTNSGTLKQTKTVNSGGTTAFLNLKNAAGTSDKYYGVEITPAGNMGSTVVAIRGNQSCSEGGGATDTVKRCYDITPTTSQSAQIRFYYRSAEQNGEAQPNVYHYSGTGTVWDLQTLVNRGGSGEGLWVTASNISSYSPFKLDDVTTAATSTPTNTPTGTTVATATTTATSTPTNTPTNTTVATATATNTPTPTPTNTSINTPTATSTASSTSVATATATNTPLPTNTGTATNTPTSTPTPTHTTTTFPTATATATGTATNTPTNTAAATATGTTTPTQTPTNTGTPTNTPTATGTPLAGSPFLVSSDSNTKIGQLSFKNEDIVLYFPDQAAWILLFDGSKVGLGDVDLEAFTLGPDTSLLMSFDKSIKIPGLGTVQRNDIVRFIPSALGDQTAGAFEWYLDGSDVGLNDSDEAIDAIALDATGNLVISTAGDFKVDNLKGKDEDLWLFTDTALGATTAGTWSLYFDGSAVGLDKSSEDIDALWINQITGELYLSTKGDFNVGSPSNVSGKENDIFICSPLALGANTACTFTGFIQGKPLGFRENIDGFFLLDLTTSTAVTSATAHQSNGSQTEVAPFALDTEVIEEIDPESALDEYDAISEDEVNTDENTLPERSYLPLIQR